MKRLWVRILQGFLAVLFVLYLGDWAVLRVQTGGKASSSVPVEQFLRTRLKGQKEDSTAWARYNGLVYPRYFPIALRLRVGG